MTKKVLFLITSLFFTSIIFAQKAQRIAYIDMQYILENVPDYTQAESQLSTKVKQWQKKVEKKQSEIAVLKTDLSNEKALLTKSLIEEREEDIAIKVEELHKLQNKYFGTDGDLYKLRKQLVKPVQDQVYNSIQEIATRRKYDFVLDKSSDLIMLYSNDKYDISDMVIKSITRDERQKDVAEKKESRKEKQKAKQDKKNTPNASAIEKKKEREDKKKLMQEKIEKQKAERKAARDKKKKEAAENRKKKLAERKAAKEKIKNSKNKTTEKAVEIIEEKSVDTSKDIEEKTKEVTGEKVTEEIKVIADKEVTEIKEELTEKEKRQQLLVEKKEQREKQRLEKKKKIAEAQKARKEAREKKKKELAEKRKAAQGNAAPTEEPEQE